MVIYAVTTIFNNNIAMSYFYLFILKLNYTQVDWIQELLQGVGCCVLVCSIRVKGALNINASPTFLL